jgi:L-alanine-DL-glutamate epimerase-like enolase superfamily enzyme
MKSGAAVERLDVWVYRVPTDQAESDGTFEWDSTTMVLVEASASGRTGLGYTYAAAPAAGLVRETLEPVVRGRDVMAIEGTWDAMTRAVRNIGRPGLASMAIAAVDVALWDLKSRLLDVALVTLLGDARGSVEAYGSGGFTSYSIERLRDQLGGWAAEGMRAVKMKIGRDAAADRDRVRAARDAIGRETALFVDANGAYSRAQALAQAERFAGDGVTWFEEPVSSDDLAGLRWMRQRAPAGMAIAAGEYGYDPLYFRRMLDADAVDVLQADATRCGGITGFLRAAALCDARGLPLSAHTAPSIHVHPCCAVGRAWNVEYFHDHARIEGMFFDGAARPVDGRLVPDRGRPGLGLEFKRADAEPFRI